MDLPKLLHETMGAYLVEKLQASWCIQMNGERHLRRRTVIALAVELDRIRQQDIFATAIGEHSIESVIEGDWKMVRTLAMDLTFAQDETFIRARYASLWQVFVAMLTKACDDHSRIERGETLVAS